MLRVLAQSICALLVAVACSETAGAAPVRGGTARMLSAGDVDFIDPGSTYYSYAMAIHNAVHRQLYTAFPGSGGQPSPDVAAGPPEVSDGGRTITIRIRPGVRFAPPVNREVVAGDVKYAIERAFSRNVANGYVAAYLGDLEGAPATPPRRPRAIRGIQTPDPSTLILRLRRSTSAAAIGALSLPVSAPVPPEYARRLDGRRPPEAGRNLPATGPYRVARYRSGGTISLVRNPSWNPATDVRPAHLDAIEIDAGNLNGPTVVRRVLTGSHLLSGDGGVGPLAAAEARRERPAQVAVSPPAGTRYVALNTKTRPFNRRDIRRAVLAGTDRVALGEARGAPDDAQVATHFLPPGMPGFEEAGGAAGPGFDFLANPRGNLALARAYLRRAGHRGGRFRGAPVTMVADRLEPDRSTARLFARMLRRLGFRVRARYVDRNAMFSRYCNVPRARVDVCPSVGWLKDFQDPQTMLDPTFRGDNILARNNSNWPQLDVPSIDRAMRAAILLPVGPERWRAWGQIDRLVTEQAPAVPIVWDGDAAVASADLEPVLNEFTGLWDLSFTGVRG